MKSIISAHLLGIAMLATANVFAATGAAQPAPPKSPPTNAASQTQPAAAHCPVGYRTDMSNVATGELKCSKQHVSCPANFTSAMDSKTGILTCTPKLEGKCPDGWLGGAEKGLLVCYPKREEIQCVKSAADWKWGDEYYSESWDVIGCFKKPKPAF